MKILGIDPGLAILGWSIIDKTPGDPVLIDFGCVRTPSDVTLTQRLTDIFFSIRSLIEKHKPAALALETLFFVKNAKALAQVGHSRGVVLLAAGQAGMSVFEYAPTQIKMALTGFGGAEKKQMQLMVQRILKLKEIPQPDDAADAVAVALCHCQYSHALGKTAVTV